MAANTGNPASGGEFYRDEMGVLRPAGAAVPPVVKPATPAPKAQAPVAPVTNSSKE